jgi:hypothetical protein
MWDCASCLEHKGHGERRPTFLWLDRTASMPRFATDPTCHTQPKGINIKCAYAGAYGMLRCAAP